MRLWLQQMRFDRRELTMSGRWRVSAFLAEDHLVASGTSRYLRQLSGDVDVIGFAYGAVPSTISAVIAHCSADAIGRIFPNPEWGRAAG